MLPENPPELENQIKSCIAGDPESFRYVFDFTKNRIFRYVFSRTSNREDALDITQEIFIDIWQALPKFKYHSLGQFYGFIFLVAKRRLIKYYRSHKSLLELTKKQPGLNPEKNYQGNIDDYQDLIAGIKRLKGKHQETLRLRYWSGLSYQEISQIFGTKESTVKVWHFRAIQKLKKILNV